MGCSPSALKSRHLLSKPKDVLEDVETETTLDLAPPPTIPVYVGSGVTRYNNDKRAIIFVFGGPGSKKGLLIEELVNEFEFQSITVEDIVLRYLPNKLANTVETAEEIQDLLKKDKSTITLDWVLNLIGARLSTSMQQRFVIDVVPSLSTILSAESFKKDNHDDEMEKFERRHQILFALDLFVPNEQSILAQTKELNKKVSEEANNTNGTADKNDKEKGISPELSAFLRGIDEADKGRLERRLDSYHLACKPFMEYFQHSKRIVRMDINTPIKEHLIKSLRELLYDFGFTTNLDAIRVVLFVMNLGQVPNLDLKYYKLQKLLLSDIIHDGDHTTTTTTQIRSVRQYLNRTAHFLQNYLVVLDTLNSTHEKPAKRINFLETKECYLDHFIRIRADQEPQSRFKQKFIAVTSTNNEVCLFPQGFSEDVCKRIGYIFGDRLNASESELVSRSASNLDDAATASAASNNSPSELEHSGSSGSGNRQQKYGHLLTVQ